MDKFIVNGGNQISGSVDISGAKNAVLPLMTAALLVDGNTTINSVPDLRDTRTMIRLLEKLGAKISLESGYILAKAKHLKGNKISFDFPSVGATGNILMASVLARGETYIENAAKEPEIVQLCEVLNQMGANIFGIGTDKITVHGVDKLHSVNIDVIPDRIEAGT